MDDTNSPQLVKQMNEPFMPPQQMNEQPQINNQQQDFQNQPNYQNQPPPPYQNQPQPYQNQPPPPYQNQPPPPNQNQPQQPYQNQPPPPPYQNQPPQPPYQNQPYPPNYNQYQNQPQVMQQQPYGVLDPHLFETTPSPVPFYCPVCQKQQISQVYPQISGGTHLAALGLCFLTGLLCCWLPYCIEGCQDTVHSCPECKTEVGRRQFMNC